MPKKRGHFLTLQYHARSFCGPAAGFGVWLAGFLIERNIRNERQKALETKQVRALPERSASAREDMDRRR